MIATFLCTWIFCVICTMIQGLNSIAKENSAQYYVNNLNGQRIFKRIDICISVTELLCCTPETNTIWLINYTPIKQSLKIIIQQFSSKKVFLKVLHCAKNDAKGWVCVYMHVFEYITMKNLAKYWRQACNSTI